MFLLSSFLGIILYIYLFVPDLPIYENQGKSYNAFQNKKHTISHMHFFSFVRDCLSQRNISSLLTLVQMDPMLDIKKYSEVKHWRTVSIVMLATPQASLGLKVHADLRNRKNGFRKSAGGWATLRNWPGTSKHVGKYGAWWFILCAMWRYPWASGLLRKDHNEERAWACVRLEKAEWERQN